MKIKAGKKLAPSERLILQVVRYSDGPVHAGIILQETQCSIHTLVPAITRLERLGHITKVDLGDGPRYAAMPTTGSDEGEVR